MVPYENASSGHKARDEITKILQRFGCESVGFMENFADKSVLLAFTHRGRPVQLNASAKGWAAMWLQENPWSSRRNASDAQWNEKAVAKGLVAINSILRDWVKGQVTAVECGLIPFEGVFMPYMLTNDGKPLIERIKTLDLLPAPQAT